MAIAVMGDNSYYAQDAGGTSHSWSHTVPVGCNFLWVWVRERATGGQATSVTFNTTETLTKVTGTYQAPPYGHSGWYLMNPTVTTANIVVEHAASGRSKYQAINLQGVSNDPASVISDSGKTSSSSTFSTVNLTLSSVSAGDMVLDMFASWDSTGYDWDIIQSQTTIYQLNQYSWIATLYCAYKEASGSSITVGYGGSQPSWQKNLAAVALAPSKAGNRGYIIAFQRWKNFLEDLKHGNVPPANLRRQYGDLVTI